MNFLSPWWNWITSVNWRDVYLSGISWVDTSYFLVVAYAIGIKAKQYTFSLDETQSGVLRQREKTLDI